MKKVKLSNNIIYQEQYQKLNEVTSTNANTGTANNSNALNIKLPDKIVDSLTDSIKNDVIRDDTFVRIKLTHNFFDTVYFPQASPGLKRLMEFVDFPGYLKDLGDRLDSDPKVNASKAIDYAAAAFTNTVFSLDPSTNIRKNDNKAKNESYEFINEAIPSAAAFGKAAGELGVWAGETVVDAVVGFSQVVGPAIGNAVASVAPAIGLGLAGMWGAGYAAGTFIGLTSSDQNPTRFTNDNQYFVDYSNIPKEVFTKSSNPIIAIEEYIKNTQRIIITLLSYITAKSARQDITDLETTIDTLTSKADKTLESFINDNNEILKKQQEIEQRLREQRFQNQAQIESTKNSILAKILNTNSIDKTTYYEKFKKAKNDILKLQDLQSELQTLTSSTDDIEMFISTLESSKHKYNKNNALLEDDNIKEGDGTEIKYITFNADNIYDDVKSTISGKITKILSTDPEDWESIKWARKEMDLMQESADKEILAKIDIICRTGNQDNLGLSSKLAAFVRKHPMRAEYLKGLWARYMRDLDIRKQKRIENISNPDNSGPMSMCISFLKNTVPSIIATMITYKTLIKLLQDQRVRGKSVDIIEDPRTSADTIKNQLDNITTRLEGQFAKYGHYLAKNQNDGKPIYDAEAHKFMVADKKKINHFGLFMSLIIPKTVISKDNVGIFLTDIDTMLNKLSNAQEFFNEFTEFIDYFGKIQILKDLNLIQYFETLNNSKNITDILDKMSNIEKHPVTFFGDTTEEGKKATGKLQYIFAYIVATKGKFIKDYENAKKAILGLPTNPKNLSDDDKQKIKKIREALHISTDKDAIKAELEDIKEDFKKLDSSVAKDIFTKNADNIDMFSIVCTLYYMFNLYNCTEYDSNIKSNEINYNIVYSLYEMITKNFEQLSMLFESDAAEFDLVHFREEYVGTNSAIDPQGMCDILHKFCDIDVKTDKDFNYQDYAKLLDNQLKSDNPIVPQDNKVFTGGEFVGENIHTFADIVKLFDGSDNYKNIDALIRAFDKVNIEKIPDIDRFTEVFKEYIKQVITKFDNNFKDQNLDAFNEFIGNVDDNKAITAKNIFVGYDSNNKPAKVTLSEFLSTYSEVVAYAQKDMTIKSLLEKATEEIDKAIKTAFEQKTSMEITFEFMELTNGLFVQMAKKDCTPANIKALIDEQEVKNGTNTYKANTDMLIKNSLLNFLPSIFSLPIMTRFINTLFGNENGKIYKYQP